MGTNPDNIEGAGETREDYNQVILNYVKNTICCLLILETYLMQKINQL